MDAKGPSSPPNANFGSSGDIKLYVTGLDPNWEKSEVDTLFGQYGRVTDSKVLIGMLNHNSLVLC